MPRPTPRSKSGKPAPTTPKPADPTTRLRLIEAAGPVFARRGFADATVREIVAEARANIAAVNYHFGDKLGLYRAVLEHYSQTAMAAHPVPRPSDDRADPRETLREFIAAFLARLFHEGKPAWMSQIITREMADPTEAFQHLAETHMRPQLDVLRAVVSRLMGLPVVDLRVQRCAASVIAQCVNYKVCAAAHRLLLSPQQTYDAAGREQLTAHIAAFSLAGIAAHTPSAPSSKAKAPSQRKRT
jgi:AcrR family transcriptional regulator